MGVKIKGKVVTGEEAKKKLGLVEDPKYKLTKDELAFVLNKLKQATYKGEEFQIFYNIYIKLSNYKTE